MQSIEELLQRRIFITNRLNNIQNVLIDLGYLEKSEFGVEKTAKEFEPAVAMEEIKARLMDNEEADIVWLHVYRTISQHLEKIDNIRQTHLQEQKINLSSNKILERGMQRAIQEEGDNVGMQPQHSSGFQHL